MADAGNQDAAVPPVPAAATSGGGGGGSGRRGGNRNNHRGNNNRNSNQRNSNSRGGSSRPSFDGREPTLKGHIYDLSTERNNKQYAMTTKEIMNWVGREYKKYTGELVEAVRTLQLAAPNAPQDPPANDAIAFERWKLAVKKHSDREEEHTNFKARLYTVVLGQCTETLEDRLKSNADWLNAQQDGIELLRLIKTVTYTFEERRYLPEALLDVKEEFYRMSQGRHEPLQRYYERFKNQVSIMEEVGVSFIDSGLVENIAAAAGRAGNPDANDRLEAQN